MILICPLDRIETIVSQHAPSHLISLLGPDYPPVPTPDNIEPKNHLRLTLNDIASNDIASPQNALIPPDPAHVAELLSFAEKWPGDRPILIHCQAGISRSPAAGYVIWCMKRPEIPERRLAQELRARAPSATPNPLIIKHADDLLGRQGRMIDAIHSIGRGESASQGDFTHLPLQLFDHKTPQPA